MSIDMKEAFIFLAEGFEEIEALSVIDVLRRGGMNVKTVSITQSLQVKGAHGVIVTADVLFDNTMFSNPEWLILPGGMPGATYLYEFAPLQGLLRRQAESSNGKIGAICASPAVVLGQLGLLKGKCATCYPGFENLLEGAEYKNDPVVVDGNIITGNGPANAAAWALAILKHSEGELKAEEVASGMLIYDNNLNDFNFG